jgi:hypothetical protein
MKAAHRGFNQRKRFAISLQRNAVVTASASHQHGASHDGRREMQNAAASRPKALLGHGEEM